MIDIIRYLVTEKNKVIESYIRNEFKSMYNKE